MRGLHGRFWFGLGLRGAGLALMTTAWLEGLRLFAHVHADHGGVGTTGELPLAMLVYLCATCGAALVIVGPHLFDRIAVSARWSRAIAEPGNRDSVTSQEGR